MRILHVISSGGIYGAERAVVTLASTQKAQGDEPVVCILRNTHNPHLELADVLQQLDLATVIIPCHGRLDPGLVRKLRASAGSLGVDLMHTHGYKADIYGFLATRRSSVPVVATCHNWTGSNVALKMYAALDRTILPRFAGVASVSDRLTETLHHLGIRHAVTVPNGICVEDYLEAQADLRLEAARPGDLIVGTVARMVPEKGIPVLLEAVARILPSFPQTSFFMVGDGASRDTFETRAREVGIANNVVFTGWRSDMPGVYRSLDIFILPSLKEGMPMALLEAIAVGGVPSVIRDGKTGILIQPDDVGSAVEALQLLLSNPTLRARLGTNAQSQIRERFSATHMAKCYDQLYRNACESARTNSAVSA